MAEPGSSPTRSVASPGARPCSVLNSATPSPTAARTRAATALPSITAAGIAAAEAIAGRGARARPRAQRVRCRAPASAAQLERDGALERVPDLGRGDVVHRLVDLQHDDDLGARARCQLAERAIGDLVGPCRRDRARPLRRGHRLIRVRRGVLGAAPQREDLDLALVGSGAGRPRAGDAHGDRDELPFLTGLGVAVWVTTRPADALPGSTRATMATAATPM